MTDPSGFAKFVPGFDFLQSLVSNAGAALPNVGQWIVPTLDPEELEKRISELRTVQFWLEQNTRMLATTIQALEVQRMTLSTLRGMNVGVNELKAGLQAGPAPQDTPATAPSAETPTVDPMQWWGSLTQQFSKLATDAMRQAADAAGPVAAAGAAAAAQAASAATAATQAATTAAGRPSAAPAPRRARPATKPLAKTASPGGGKPA